MNVVGGGVGVCRVVNEVLTLFFLSFAGSHTNALCQDCPKGRFGNLTGLTSIDGVHGVCSKLNASGFATMPLELTEVGCGPEQPCSNTDSICVITANACFGCSLGKYLSDAGETSETSCQNCPQGRYGVEIGASDMTEYCHECPVGFWSNRLGITNIHACTKCALGRFSTAVGMTMEINACLLCAKGYYSSVYPTHDDPVKENECVPCAKGSYLNIAGGNASTDCVHCPAGKYLPEEASTKIDDCKLCPAGTYLDETGKVVVHECKPCVPGKKGVEMGLVQNNHTDSSIGCQACPVGTYQQYPKQAVCARPDPGYFANSAGLVYVEGCPMGKYSIDSRESCDACPLGKYNDLERYDCCSCCVGIRGLVLLTCFWFLCVFVVVVVLCNAIE